MWQFLIGLATGACGVLVKDYFTGNKEQQNCQSQLNSILEENDKLRKKTMRQNVLLKIFKQNYLE